jgi:hypothetical protein
LPYVYFTIPGNPGRDHGACSSPFNLQFPTMGLRTFESAACAGFNRTRVNLSRKLGNCTAYGTKPRDADLMIAEQTLWRRPP